MFKQSEACILEGDPCCSGGKRLGKDSEERVVLLRAARRELRLKERRAFAVKEGVLDGDDKPRAPRWASGKGIPNFLPYV